MPGRRRAAAAPRSYLLEILPPRVDAAGPGAVENLLAGAALRGGCALEIAARDGVPRFLARAPSEAERDHLARQVLGHYPQGEVRLLDDPADDPARLEPHAGASARLLRLRGSAVLPLRTYRDLDARDGADPLLGVIGALVDLPPGLRGVVQLALWPVDPRWGEQAARALASPPGTGGRAERDAAARGGSPWPLLVAGGLGLSGAQAWLLYQQANTLGLALLGVGAATVLPGALWLVHALRPTPPPDPQLMREKLAHRGFLACPRLLVVGGGAGRAGEHARAAALDRLVAAYGPFELAAGNALTPRRCPPGDLLLPQPRAAGRGPLPLLNAREAASLWHLPTPQAAIPGLRRAGSRALLAAHPALLDPTGVAVGVSRGQGRCVPVTLPTAHLERHVAVIGSSGTGKTTFALALARGILADPSWGLFVLDPHSALAAGVLAALPPARAAAARCVNCADKARPVALNLLDAHDGRTLSQIEEGLIVGLRYHWDGSWGPRMENVFRYALRTLLQANRVRARGDQYTLLAINPLLANGPFRMEVLRQTPDRDLQRYWLDHYANLTRQLREASIQPVLNKVDRFNQEVMANIVGQSATTLSFDGLLDHAAPLIVDTASWEIGTDNAGLLGSTLLSLLADRMRARGVGAQKVAIMVDEFQMTPADWGSLVESLRKFGGSCILCTQSLAAIEDVQTGLRGALFGNLGTVVCFRVSAEDARYLVPELNEDVEVTDAINLPNLRAYIRSTDGRQRLPVFSVDVPLPPPGDTGIADAVLARTARAWGRDGAAALAQRQAFLERIYTPNGLAPVQGGQSGSAPRSSGGGATAGGPPRVAALPSGGALGAAGSRTPAPAGALSPTGLGQAPAAAGQAPPPAGATARPGGQGARGKGVRTRNNKKTNRRAAASAAVAAASGGATP